MNDSPENGVCASRHRDRPGTRAWATRRKHDMTSHDMPWHHITSHCTTDTRAWATRPATTSSGTSPSSARRSSARRARPRLRREEEEASRAVDRGGRRPAGTRRAAHLLPPASRCRGLPPGDHRRTGRGRPDPEGGAADRGPAPSTEHGDAPRKRRTAAARVGERGTCRDSFATRLLVGARTRPSSSTSPRRPKASSVRSFVRGFGASGLRGSFGLSLLP